MDGIMCNLIIDSCCDLPAPVIDIPGVKLLRFPYFVDGVEYEDDLFVSRTAQDFYDAMRRGAAPSTAQIPMTVLTEAFTEALESGVPTVYLGFSSGLSGSFDTASLLCSQLKQKHPEGELLVVDTKLASIAEGLLVFEALKQRAKGLTAQELAAWAEEARFYVNEQFMLDSLDSLSRGGRIPPTVALAGSKLDVKPIMDISLDGRLSLSGVARGRKKGIRQLVEYYAKHRVDAGGPSHIVIGSADCPKDVERIKSELAKVDESVLFLDTSIGPVIGSHVGPGMIAIAFMGSDARENLSVSDRIARKVRSR